MSNDLMEATLTVEDRERPYKTHLEVEVESPEFVTGDRVRSSLSNQDMLRGEVVEVIANVSYMYRVQFEGDQGEPGKFFAGALLKTIPFNVQAKAHALVDEVVAALNDIPEEHRSEVMQELAEELTEELTARNSA